MLGEGAAIVGVLYECFFADETQVDVFDAVRMALSLFNSPGPESSFGHPKNFLSSQY